jgi:hypothetical protein
VVGRHQERAVSSELEQKIADALNGADLDSTEIAALITEVEAAAVAAGETATKVREDALNPSTIVDAAEVGGRIASAELRRDRLKAAVPKLQQQWHEVAVRESLAVWQVDFDKIRDERDELVAEFEDEYPKAVAKLVSLMKRAAEVDWKITYVLSNRPPRAQGYLECVEETVRGKIMLPDVWIKDTLRLPVLHRNGGSTYAYPPPEQNIGVLMATMAPAPHYDGDVARRQIAERDERLLADAARAARDDLARQREREEKERLEGEAARARDRAEYRKRGWPPPL